LLIREGKDPIDERKASLAQRKAKVTVTFAEAARAFHKHHSAAGRWSNGANKKLVLRRLEKFTFPTLGEVPIHAIDRAAILRAFTPFWAVGTVHAASRCLADTASVFEFAKARGWCSGDNPARGDFSHDLPSPRAIAPTRAMPSLPYAAVPEFYASLGDTVTEMALRWTILNAVRSQETLGARWSEIDLDKGLWTIPAERTKKDREHVVPLSRAAMDIIGKLVREKGNPYLFVGARPGTQLSRLAMLGMLRHRKCDFVVHGFRSSFRTWAAEETAFAPDLIEAALAHAIGTAVERAYNRGQLVERRRALMAAWADHVTGAARGQVVPLRA
jgi:integrase